jgi:hypothetical protein
MATLSLHAAFNTKTGEVLGKTLPGTLRRSLSRSWPATLAMYKINELI